MIVLGREYPQAAPLILGSAHKDFPRRGNPKPKTMFDKIHPMSRHLLANPETCARRISDCTKYKVGQPKPPDNPYTFPGSRYGFGFSFLLRNCQIRKAPETIAKAGDAEAWTTIILNLFPIISKLMPRTPPQNHEYNPDGNMSQ